jgi:hypothetical protein
MLDAIRLKSYWCCFSEDGSAVGVRSTLQLRFWVVVSVEPVLACPHHPVAAVKFEKIIIADRHRDVVRNIGVGDAVITYKVRDFLEGSTWILCDNLQDLIVLLGHGSGYPVHGDCF